MNNGSFLAIDHAGQFGLFDSAGLHARAPIERMHRIALHLRDGHVVNCTTFAREFEVARKTVLRDVEFMRDRLGYDVEWDGISYVLRNAPLPIL